MEKLGVKPIQDGGGSGKNLPPTSFSPVTSTNAGISAPNFLILSFSPFVTLVSNLNLVPVPDH